MKCLTSDLHGVDNIDEGALVSAELGVGPESLVSNQQLRIEGLLACAGERGGQGHVKASLSILRLLQNFVS